MTIEHLIIKYLTNSISEQELDELIQLLEDSNNDDVFDAYVKVNYSLNFTMTDYNSNKVKEELLKKIKKDKKNTSFKYKNILKYAAIFACVLGASYFMYNSDREVKNSIANDNGAHSHDIILRLDNGDTKIIKTDENNRLKNSYGTVYGVQKKDTLKYDNVNAINELVYNELTVPYGKRFNIILSDGTKVELNAGSYIKYPIQFFEGKERKIVLKGEAYFDVAHNEKDRFIVSAGNLDVEVLGTKFNMSFYPEDDEIETVLVEGSVIIRETNPEGNNDFLLKPGHLATYNKKFKEMAIIKTDVTFHTAWRHGAIRFKSTPFKNIIKKLNRHFNQEIINHYRYLDEQIYTASFYDGETVEEILSYFTLDTAFKYSNDNNKIIITNPLNK